MVRDKVVCERWYVTKMVCDKDGVRQAGGGRREANQKQNPTQSCGEKKIRGSAVPGPLGPLSSGSIGPLVLLVPWSLGLLVSWFSWSPGLLVLLVPWSLGLGLLVLWSSVLWLL